MRGRPMAGNPRASLFGAGRGGGTPTGMRTDATADQMQQDNDAAIVDLHDQVRAVRSITQGIGSELRRQNEDLRNLDDRFTAARGALSGTMNRLTAMAKATNGRHMWVMVAFIVALFLAFWWFAKR
eukprot:TRINITY_DN67653_c0_g1_i1.p1 TRINITY_DN67653_c0_g1~~TRINITY_DN67653_c0_g1_i1.p1  ORF type:complete len:126 (-),score=26.96 TRINITY_DN67653_c0_g1_i1:234-611(-)